jgi:transcriptional regulator with XRE-family HTH domain
MVSLEVPPCLGIASKQQASSPDFPQHKQRSLTREALAERIGIQVVQLRRYEAGASQSTLDMIRKLATALSVSADLLLFGKDERGTDDDLRLQFEAVSRINADEKQVPLSLLEGMVLKHEARRWSTPAAKENGR